MKSKFAQIVIITATLLISNSVFSQNAKKLYKSGKDYSKIGNFEKAVELYSQAIDLSPEFIKAIEGRAVAYNELMLYQKAASDFELLSELKPKNSEYIIKAGMLYHQAGKYNNAIPLLESAIETNPENAEIQSIISKCYFAVTNFKLALAPINNAIELNPTADNFYQRGLVQSELTNYLNAENDFSKSIQLNANNSETWSQLGYVQLRQEKQEKALESLNNAINIDAKNKKALLLRSHIFSQNNNLKSAIEDLTKLTNYYPNESVVFYQRGSLFLEDKQYKNAVEDLSKLLELQEDNQHALEKRGMAYEMLNEKKLAVKDYKKLRKILIDSKGDKEFMDKINNRLFELQREKNPPELFIVQKNAPNQSIIVPEGPDEASIVIKITDESDIKSIKVDGTILDFSNDSIRSGQELVVDILEKNKLNFEITDVYNNTTSVGYTLIRKDTGFPRVVITTPLSPAGNKIFLKSLNSELELKGRIVSKYKIKSILINDFEAQFNSLDDNPAFTSSVNIENVNEITFDVLDTDGNHLVKRYMLDRSDAEILSANPMGRTWVVFIENSDYNNFTNLEGPKKEVDLMVKALSKYRIDKIVHKRNLTKGQMDWFFRNELKQLVKENRVNSILLWYAGHGKFVNDNGFWIPVDSKPDDVQSYYNLSSLKSAMKPYSDQISHSLIVTDACESGPGFYMAMRSIPTDRDCNDGKSTRFKSSQVFTSSGNDLSDGDSEFTKTFANSLIFNGNNCIPIEKIVTTVSSAVLKNNNKRPTFGKISGFADENGSFIFVKK